MRFARIPFFVVLAAIIGLLFTAPATAADQGISAAIQEQANGRLKKFYAERSFRPLWASAGKIGPEAETLLSYLASANRDGLKPSTYKVDHVRSAIADARTGDARTLARAELLLSSVFARYVSDMRRAPKVKMTFLDAQLKPKKLKADAVLRAAALPRSFKDYMASMGWMSPHYVRMRTLMARADGSIKPDVVERRLRLNLDRARLLPAAWAHHIVVDAASGRLWYYQAGKQQGTMRVVVGKPSAQTPMLAGMVQYAILNPYWNVPVDLAQTLIAPKVLAGQSLQSMGFEALSNWSASPARRDPASINWSAIASGAQEIRIRQLPGASNSMGRVKFMFPNDQGIYLHDTPERALFAKDNRHFSNGCIRLEDAAGLGKWLLGTSIRAASKAPEQVVALRVPIPIYLTYFTATGSGQDGGFRQDVYGRDQ
jgi:L,D-transpeptidase YcbB